MTYLCAGIGLGQSGACLVLFVPCCGRGALERYFTPLSLLTPCLRVFPKVVSTTVLVKGLWGQALCLGVGECGEGEELFLGLEYLQSVWPSL